MEAAFYRAVRIISRIGLCLALVQFGIDTMTEPGERVFNKYLHAVRKEVLPGTKPSDASPLGMSWNDFNKSAIMVEGGLLIFAGACYVIGQKFFAGITLILATVFMVGTKDNIWLKSDVSAITREKKDRIEWLFADISLLGVAIAMIGGLGWTDDDKKKKSGDKDE